MEDAIKTIGAEMETSDPDDLLKLAGTLRLLANMATWKAKAVRSRLQGQINSALEFEEGVEDLYKELPERYRW